MSVEELMEVKGGTASTSEGDVIHCNVAGSGKISKDEIVADAN